MFDFDRLAEAMGDEEGILLTKFLGWHDVQVGDVLAKSWPQQLPVPAGWTQSGGWIFKTHTGFTLAGIRPDIRARKV